MPLNPYPMILRRVLRRMLPESIYRRHIGRHEDGSLAFWRWFSASAPPGAVILDIGAFHGEYSLAATEANPRARVVAFEPNPTNVEVLRRSCSSKGVEIFPLAVAETTGVVRFLCASARSRITTPDEANRSQPEEVVEVPSVSPDS